MYNFYDFSYMNDYDAKSENLNNLLYFSKLLIITKNAKYFQVVTITN
jgi:hypothetical protein